MVNNSLIKISNAKQYNFFQLVELLHNVLNNDPESKDWQRDCNLIFSANPGLGFATNDIEALHYISEQCVNLKTNFLGLSGAHSPLPSFLLEQIAVEDEIGVRALFLDFFTNRLTTLFYQVWRKYRYYIRFKEEASDPLSAQLFSLVGLADQGLRGDTPINWCKMLAYSGILAGKSRSPQVVSGVIAHCFDLSDVSIREWEMRKVSIPKEQRFILSGANAQLGIDTVIGSHINDCTGKFTICIKSLSNQRFKDFLPSGKEHQALCKLVEFVLREQMAFDLELEVNKNLRTEKGGDSYRPLLGWNFFAGEIKSNQSIRLQVRR